MNRKQDCWYKNVCSYESCINCIRYSEMKYLIENSGIPKGKQKPQELEAGIDYDKFLTLANIKDYILDYVDIGDFNVYICSRETGNGKTSWAIKILLKYFDQIWAGNGFRVRGMFVHVPTLLSKLKDFNNPLLKSYRDNLSNADLIIWDDIAAAKLSDYDISQLLIILDERITFGKANIYTGNITTKEGLEKAVGGRLASRIWNCSQVIEFKGKDRRYGSVTSVV